MKPLFGLNWRSLSAELLVVFIGLFAALQLDDWREEREFYEAETRYLTRLHADLTGFLEFAGAVIPVLERNYEAVRHVSDSLAAGKIIDGDTRQFERGLIYVSMLPALQVQRSSYDEMVASGMFARLRSEELKSAVSELFAVEETVTRNFTWWRAAVEKLSNDILDRIGLYSEDRMDTSSALFLNEPVRRASFEFDALAADPVVRNGYYWAVDTHSDWVLWTGRVAEIASTALELLEEELARR